jgi:hypothetical protein
MPNTISRFLRWQRPATILGCELAIPTVPERMSHLFDYTGYLFRI